MNETRDPIPKAVREVADFYAAHPELRFPDVDHEVLAEHCEQLRQHALDVKEAQDHLDALMQAQAEQEASLLAQARRAFAYAQIYAEKDEELKATLAGFELARPSQVGRGRPRKARKPSAARASGVTRASNELPFEAESAAPDAPGSDGTDDAQAAAGPADAQATAPRRPEAAPPLPA